MAWAYRDAVTSRNRQQEAETERARAEHQLWIGNAVRLAAEARAVRDENPPLSLLLAIESVKATNGSAAPKKPWRNPPVQPGEPPSTLPIAYESLIETVANIGGIPFERADDVIQCASVSPDGRWLVVGCRDAIHVLKAGMLFGQPGNPAYDKAFSHELPSQGLRDIRAIAFSSDGHLAVGTRDCRIRVFDSTAQNASFRDVLDGSQGVISDLAFTPDGTYVAVSGTRKTVVWNLAADETEPELALETQGRSMSIAPDGRWLAVGNRVEKTLRVWPIGQSDFVKDVQTLADDFSVTAVSFSPSGRWLIATGERTRLWRVPDDHNWPAPMVLTDRFGWPVYAAFDPSERFLALDFASNGIGVWSLEGLSPGPQPIPPTKVLHGHTRRISALTFLPGKDRAVLAPANSDRTTRIWDLDDPVVETGAIVPGGHATEIADVTPSPDGRSLITVGANEVRLWHEAGSSYSAFPVVICHPGNSVERAWFCGPDSFCTAANGELRKVSIRGGTVMSSKGKFRVELQPLGRNNWDNCCTMLQRTSHLKRSPNGRWLVTDDGEHLQLCDTAAVSHAPLKRWPRTPVVAFS